MSDNPSAFPTHDQTPTTDPRERILQGGMTLRDYFAGQALAMLASENCSEGGAGFYDPKTAAGRSYAIADAMLAARTGDAQAATIAGIEALAKANNDLARMETAQRDAMRESLSLLLNAGASYLEPDTMFIVIDPATGAAIGGKVRAALTGAA